MSLCHLFGLEDLDLSDAEIMGRIKEAFDKDLHEIEFVKVDGTKVIIKLPHVDFEHHTDPWDGHFMGAA